MSIARRWHATQAFSIDGLDFRVREGRKGPGDLVLDYRLPRGWTPVPMAVTFAMVDFFYENEENLYPRSAGYAGGEFLMRRLRLAVKSGYVIATRLLDGEKESGQRGVQATLTRDDGGAAASTGSPRSAIFDFEEEAA